MSERSTLYIFRLGEAHDDLTPMFAVDGRDYPDDEAVRVDVRAAVQALADRHFIADFESSGVPPEAPASGLPSWPQWRARHLDGDEPIGVRPRPLVQPVPEGWDDLGRWLEQARLWIVAQVEAAVAAVPGARVRAVGEPEPRRVGPASVVLAEERWAVEAEFLLTPPVGGSGRGALDRLAGWLRANRWSVAPFEERPTTTVLAADSSGYTITAVWNHRGTSVRVTGASPAVDATHFEGGSGGAAHV